MAAPSVQPGGLLSFEPAQTTAHNVVMPPVNAGELMLLKIATGGTPVITMPEGWEAAYAPVTFTAVSLACFKKISDGTEGGTTVTFTTDISVKSSRIACAITGWVGDLKGVVAAPVASTANSASANPPEVEATWTGGDNLFLAQMSMQRTSALTGYPTNYVDNNAEISSGSAGQDALVAIATRALTADSDDPNSFTAAIARRCIAQTLVIAPVGAELPSGTPTSQLVTPVYESIVESIVR